MREHAAMRDRHPSADESRPARRVDSFVDAGPTKGRQRAVVSLRARALKWLSMREHSRAELSRKLAAHTEDRAEIESLLDQLQQAGHLSDDRFVQSLVRRRSERFGRLRIALELRGHDLDPPLLREAADGLRESERQRALQVWIRRFGQRAADLSELGRQRRFLAQRGFDADAIAWVLRHANTQSDDS